MVLFKTSVRCYLFGVINPAMIPTDFFPFYTIEHIHVRFNIKQRRAVDNIDIGNIDHIVLDANDFDHRNPYGVGRFGARVAKTPCGRVSRNGTTSSVYPFTRCR